MSPYYESLQPATGYMAPRDEAGERPVAVDSKRQYKLMAISRHCRRC